MSRRVLVLYAGYLPIERERATIVSHLRMLETTGADLDIVYYNAIGGNVPRALYRRDIDVVILHTLLLGMRWHPLFNYWKRTLDWLKQLDCLKIALPQDEYDHAEVLDEWLYELGVTHVFSNFGADSWTILYPLTSERAKFGQIFTGYIDEAVAQRIAPTLKPIAERPVDIVYRARHLPYWYGSYGQLKHRIGEVVAERAQSRGMTVDISSLEQDTIYGESWFEFLASGRVVIGIESGLSAMDPRGNIRAQIQAILKTNPNLTFEQISPQLPSGWDNYNFLAIGPRHLEAVVTKTCQVLIAGHYDGVLRAGEHYIPLNRDFSNLESVLDQLQDNGRLQTIAENAYRDVYLSGKYTYRFAAEKLLRAVEDSPVRPHADVRQWSYLRKYSMIEGEIRRSIVAAQNGLNARFWKYLSNA